MKARSAGRAGKMEAFGAKEGEAENAQRPTLNAQRRRQKEEIGDTTAKSEGRIAVGAKIERAEDQSNIGLGWRCDRRRR